MHLSDLLHLSSRFRATAASAFLLMATVAAYAGHPPSFDAVYVFGDSYCDVGNLYAADGGTYPPPPYYNGRFSNAPLWVEHVAGTYHLPMTPSLAGGTDYAFGGAEVLAPFPFPGGSLSIPSVPQQVEQYLSGHKFEADPNALYIVEGGGNDILNATSGSPEELGEEIAERLLDTIRRLERSGARYILVPRLFDVGLLPAAQAGGISAFASTATAALNRTLDRQLRSQSFTRETRLYRIDTYSLFQSIITDPSHYGFSDVTHPCLDRSVSPPTLCSNPYTNLFWDSEHPTAFGHAFFAVLAEQALQH